MTSSDLPAAAAAIDFEGDADRYEAALAALDDEIRPMLARRTQIEHVLTALAASRPEGQHRSHPRRHLRGELVRSIQEEPGHSAQHHANRLQVGVAQVRQQLLAMVEVGEVVRTGERSNTEYFPISAEPVQTAVAINEPD